MTDKSNQPIIVKRKKVVAGDGHHGGAWKVAYADFVTAMMAFFLLMWLLNATTEEQRKGLADYFKPTIPVHRTSGGGDGPLGGDSAFAEQVMVQNGTGATRETPSSEDKARGIEGSTETQDENDSLTAVDTELLSISGESDVEDTIHEHIRTVVTDEGLIIELFELPGKPLWDEGGVEPNARLEELLALIAQVIQASANPVALRGHLDAVSLRTQSYDVWDLSTDRALAARRSLVRSGLAPARIAQVAGKGDRSPSVADLFDPRNRRLEVVLLRDFGAQP